MSTSMNQSSLFGDQEDQIQIQIPTQMGLVPFPANLSSSFLPLGGGAIAAPSSLSSSEEGLISSTTPNLLVETLLASTLHKPRHQDLISTSSFGAGGEQQLLSLNRSSANSWAWGGVTDCLMGKRIAGGEYGHHDRHHRHHQYLGISAMKMKKILKGRRKVREPRFCFKTMSDVDVLDDGYKWRKYGQKVVKNTQHPRSYYRCTQDNCRVKKRVERLAEDPRMVITTYEGRHVHSPSNELEDSQTHPSQLNDFLW